MKIVLDASHTPAEIQRLGPVIAEMAGTALQAETVLEAAGLRLPPDLILRVLPNHPGEVDFGGSFLRVPSPNGGRTLHCLAIHLSLDLWQDGAGDVDLDRWLAAVDTDREGAVARLAREEGHAYVLDPVAGLPRIASRVDALKQMVAHEMVHFALPRAPEGEDHGPAWRQWFRFLLTALSLDRPSIEARAVAQLATGDPLADVRPH